jgi:ABC-type Fe3+/spermidine/putrescine transport system ATPase subunit
MRSELRSLQSSLGQTTIYVTHDQEEALSLSDRIALMDGGRLIEVGAPRDLYLRPRHAFTARFIGQAEFLPCRNVKRNGSGLQAETPLGPLLVTGAAPETVDLLLIRPEHIRLRPPGSSSNGEPNCFTGKVTQTTFSGKLVEYGVEVSGHRLMIQSPSNSILNPGDEVRLQLPPDLLVPLQNN